MMTRDYLCKSAQDRLKKLAIAGTIPAAWAGYRNYNQLPTGKGGQKALGALQIFMAVEAALDFGDMDVYCK